MNRDEIRHRHRNDSCRCDPNHIIYMDNDTFRDHIMDLTEADLRESIVNELKAAAKGKAATMWATEVPGLQLAAYIVKHKVLAVRSASADTDPTPDDTTERT